MKKYVLTIMVVLCASSVFAASALEWTDASDNEDGFIVEKKINATYTEVGRVAMNVVTFPVSIGPGESYCFRVFAYNAAGKSSPSNEACGTFPMLPNAPTNFKLKVVLDFLFSGEIHE